MSANTMPHTNISFNLVSSRPSYYADGYELYFTSNTTDINLANKSFGIGTKYLTYNHPKRFWNQAYHIESYVADGGVYIKIGIPYLD